MSDPFVDWIPVVEPATASTGPLAGLRLAVKDLFDVAGMPTGAGNPRWLETHDIPEADAAAVARLREAGAGLVGKTITDELAWSLNGTNAHYGTPENPAAPGRMPGGSSAGSASAVALGLADIGLGTDTGGSVRVPASYCGLYGLRPTHGRVPMDGTVPLAPTFDTAGVLTRDAATLGAAMRVLLDPPARDLGPITSLCAPSDIWDDQTPEVRDALWPALERLGLEIDRTPLFDAVAPSAAPSGYASSQLEAARVAYTTLQGHEAWQAHGEWVRATDPEFGPGVAARFARAAQITAEELAPAEQLRGHVSRLLTERLADGVALAIPAAPGPSPRLGDQPDREAIVRLTCPAGLSGAPALAVPSGQIGGLPIGLQFVASPGSDEALLDLADQA